MIGHCLSKDIVEASALGMEGGYGFSEQLLI